MKILEFCEKYNNMANQQLKDRLIKEKLEVKTYLPFVTKVTLASKVINISMYEYEDYIDNAGEAKRRKTGKIKMDSAIQYLLFCRLVIENYTNLESETEGFFEEYDALNQSGLMEKIMQMIPEKELAEFNTVFNMKKNDVIFNETTVQSFISSQIERITTIGSTVLKPVLDKIATEIENMDEAKVEKVLSKISKRIK